MPNPWIILLCIALVAGDFSWGFYYGDKHATNKIELADSKKVIAAQTNVINEGKQSAAVNTQIGGDYDKQVEDIDAQFQHSISSVSVQPSGSTPSSVRAVPAASCPVNGAAKDRAVIVERTNKQLCLIELSDLQKWVHQQSVIYSH